MRKSSVVLCGYARLPENMTAGEIYRVMGVGLEVDCVSETVLDAEVTLTTELGRRFMKEVMVGRSIRTDAGSIVAEIEDRYYGAGRKAIITAFKDACAQYVAYVKDHSK